MMIVGTPMEEEEKQEEQKYNILTVTMNIFHTK